MLLKSLVVYMLIICANACLWDEETLVQERSIFPSTLELIAGKFPRHSTHFYQWRIKDRLQKIENDHDNLALYDDLAVSYDKVGEHSKAIEVMLQKEKKSPGLYETYANMGTFYIHSRQYKKGLIYIDKAIAINPDAHFGREVYQKYLVEYLLSKMIDSKITLPLFTLTEKAKHYKYKTVTDYISSSRSNIFVASSIFNGFVDFLQKKQGKKFSRHKAVNGILGMMRFGNFSSPILLEVLAHLLIEKEHRHHNASKLACRAFLQASSHSKDTSLKKIYYDLAKLCISGHRNPKQDFETEQKQFTHELQDANNWYTKLCEDEKKWIATNKDVEKKFQEKYYKNIAVIGLATTSDISFIKIILLFLLVVCIYFALKKIKKYRFAISQTS
ncbi:hypothetical protein [Candidatus Uabimicrobium sp. HlEnr_7]|uniref:hypothetical protein n=1 Tax=Candidatus Uabimicrobium helgolandensis TaxID=3095367 RepID=UPI0035579FE6